jgi:O-succinylbenzoate synthase
VKRIWVSPYELTPRGQISELAQGRVRSGCLIKVEFKDERVGFADLFPWPELGDAPLGEQLKLLARAGEGGLTPLLVNSLEFARVDALARSEARSLWSESLEIPLSHYLIRDPASGEGLNLNKLKVEPTKELAKELVEELEDARRAGFDHFKLKLPGDPGAAAKIVVSVSRLLTPSCRLRLDFSQALSVASYLDFCRQLTNVTDIELSIDYVEDPTAWISGSGFGVPESPFTPAVDREATAAILSGYCPPVIVIKPALQDWKYCARRAREVGIRPVFSSYLDHPVGQAFAAWAASQSGPHEVCGLLSHLVYEPHDFSAELAHQGTRLIPPAGTGIGFDHLLAQRNWRNVST